MSERYADLVAGLRAAVLEGAGVTPSALRRAVEARGEASGGGAAAGGGPTDVAPELAGFVEKVARRAYTVTQADVDALRAAGYSEDAVFEITASAAVGAALGRLQRGLAALRGAAGD